MKTVKSALVRTKNFAYKHRVAIAVIATTAVFITLNGRRNRLFDEFLLDHDIDPSDFWTPEEY